MAEKIYQIQEAKQLIENDSNKSEALKSFIKKDTLFIDRDNITILIPK